MASIQIQPPLLWTAGTMWPPVCLAIVLSRFAVRRSQRNRYGPDDWIMVPALVLIFGMAATILAGVAQHALGYPTPKPEPGREAIATSPQQTVTRKAYMAVTLLQTAALTFIKISCMLFYQRIFRSASPVANALIYPLIALISIWGVGFFVSFLFACNTHFDYFWTNLENQLKCPADLSKIDLSLSISDVIMDFIILIFPMPWILRMRLSLSKKCLVIGIFTLGGLAVAASITRLVIIVEELKVEFLATADEDFVSTAGLYFMFNEACFALVAVCLPSLSGLRKKWAVQNIIDNFRGFWSNVLLNSHERMIGSRNNNNNNNNNPSNTPGMHAVIGSSASDGESKIMSNDGIDLEM